jgi:hypothetical protein
MWFTIKERLWTADWLERHGLNHPSECVFCCQEPETSAHIILQCLFFRQIWYMLLLGFRLHRFSPSADLEIPLWWSSLSAAVPRSRRKEINALALVENRPNILDEFEL